MRGRLAGAVRPEQAEHGAGLDLEVDALERLDVAEVLDERFCADDHIAHERVMVAGVTDSRPPFFEPVADVDLRNLALARRSRRSFP